MNEGRLANGTVIRMNNLPLIGEFYVIHRWVREDAKEGADVYEIKPFGNRYDENPPITKQFPAHQFTVIEEPGVSDEPLHKEPMKKIEEMEWHEHAHVTSTEDGMNYELLVPQPPDSGEIAAKLNELIQAVNLLIEAENERGK